MYDGTSRAIQTQQHLRIAGQGASPPVADESNLALTLDTQLPPARRRSACIVTTSILDGNGRLTQLIDDRGDVTLFQFDTLDRQTTMTFHDGSTRTSVFDEAGDVVTYTDENGSVFSNTFDALGRKTAVSIALASGVVGTTAQAFQLDGLSRLTFCSDSVRSTNADVTMVYDSLSRVLEESQTYGGNTRNVTNTAFTSYPVTRFAVPERPAADEQLRRALPPHAGPRRDQRGERGRLAVLWALSGGGSHARQRPDLHLDEQLPHQ